MQTEVVVTEATRALGTQRILRAGVDRVFAAFQNADELALWWGPQGFTNTFEVFDFRPGGRWVFTMYGPNGASYPNESVFHEIDPGRKVVIEHVVNPWFMLTVTLTPDGEGTHLVWVQEFESVQMAERIHSLVGDANEQVLDRLEAVLAGADVQAAR